MEIQSRIYDSFGMTKDQRMMAVYGFLSGPNGLQMQLGGTPDRVVQFDDFNGKTISGLWGVAKGSDGGAANFAINAALDGTARGVTGAGGGATMAVNGIRLDSALSWAGSQGGMDIQFRIKASAVANLAIFVGWSNQVGTLSMPAYGTGGGNGVTYNDADCAGFLYDSTMTIKDWWLIGNAASAAAPAQDSLAGPTLAVYDVLRIEISKAGNVAAFFRNGIQVGLSMPAPLTLATPMTPVIAAFARSAASINVDADYVYATQLR